MRRKLHSGVLDSECSGEEEKSKKEEPIQSIGVPHCSSRSARTMWQKKVRATAEKCLIVREYCRVGSIDVIPPRLLCPATLILDEVKGSQVANFRMILLSHIRINNIFPSTPLPNYIYFSKQPNRICIYVCNSVVGLVEGCVRQMNPGNFI